MVLENSCMFFWFFFFWSIHVKTCSEIYWPNLSGLSNSEPGCKSQENVIVWHDMAWWEPWDQEVQRCSGTYREARRHECRDGPGVFRLELQCIDFAPVSNYLGRPHSVWKSGHSPLLRFYHLVHDEGTNVAPQPMTTSPRVSHTPLLVQFQKYVWSFLLFLTWQVWSANLQRILLC